MASNIVKDQIDEIVKAMPKDVLEAIVFRVCDVVASSGDEGLDYEWSDSMEAIYRVIKGEAAHLAEVIK